MNSLPRRVSSMSPRSTDAIPMDIRVTLHERNNSTVSWSSGGGRNSARSITDDEVVRTYLPHLTKSSPRRTRHRAGTIMDRALRGSGGVGAGRTLARSGKSLAEAMVNTVQELNRQRAEREENEAAAASGVSGRLLRHHHHHHPAVTAYGGDSRKGSMTQALLLPTPVTASNVAGLRSDLQSVPELVRWDGPDHPFAATRRYSDSSTGHAGAAAARGRPSVAGGAYLEPAELSNAFYKYNTAETMATEAYLYYLRLHEAQEDEEERADRMGEGAASSRGRSRGKGGAYGDGFGGSGTASGRRAEEQRLRKLLKRSEDIYRRQTRLVDDGW